jgi:hypothetical protein
MAISIKDLLGQDETWIFLFLMAAVSLNWPMLSLPKGSLFGYPAILIYIAIVWLLIIISAYIFDGGDSS